jgi:hypothetical protein
VLEAQKYCSKKEVMDDVELSMCIVSAEGISDKFIIVFSSSLIFPYGIPLVLTSRRFGALGRAWTLCEADHEVSRASAGAKSATSLFRFGRILFILLLRQQRNLADTDDDASHRESREGDAYAASAFE